MRSLLCFFIGVDYQEDLKTLMLLVANGTSYRICAGTLQELEQDTERRRRQAEQSAIGLEPAEIDCVKLEDDIEVSFANYDKQSWMPMKHLEGKEVLRSTQEPCRACQRKRNSQALRPSQASRKAGSDVGEHPVVLGEGAGQGTSNRGTSSPGYDQTLAPSSYRWPLYGCQD